jgi:cell wall-associated NlpC family hydrolase
MAVNGGSFITGAGGSKTVSQQNTQNAVLPSARVAQFKNTNISGVLNNQTPLVNQQGQTENQTDAVDPATASLDRQQAMVNGGNNHSSLMSMYAQVKANKDAAAAAAKAAAAQPTVRATGGTTFATGGGLGASYDKRYNTNNGLSASRNKALATASSYLGTPYRLGGLSHQAIDCSGLVIAVYAQMGFNVPHNARIQGQIMGQRTSVANLRPGDLVAWNNGSHIAIYAGNGMIIEAANPRVGTVKRRLWSSAVYGVRLRLPGE